MLSATGATEQVSIHARRVTGDKSNRHTHHKQKVSIHARRVTGDKSIAATRVNVPNVSIHARRVTGDKPAF